MGLLIFRNIARKNEVHTYPAVHPRWGTYSIFKASQTQPVVMRGIRSSTPLYVTPYAIGGAGAGPTWQALRTVRWKPMSCR